MFVELAGLLERGDDASDLGVGVREEGREALHEPGREALLVGRERVPGGDPVGTRRELGSLGDDALGDLAGEDRVAPRIPAHVEAPGVLLDPLGRRLVRRVARAGAEVEEERLLGVDGPQVVDALDRVVGEVLGEVVAVLVGAGWLDEVVVVHEVGCELVGLAVEEAVEALEAAPERPPRPGAGEMRVLVGGQVPLADRVGRVALVAQDLGEEPGRAGDASGVPGEAAGQVRDPSHPDRVVVAAGEEAGPGRRAEGGGVEARVLQAAGGETVERRRVDVGAVAAELCEADVVEHDEHHVGCALGRSVVLGPPGLRLAPVPPDRCPGSRGHRSGDRSSGVGCPAGACS